MRRGRAGRCRKRRNFRQVAPSCADSWDVCADLRKWMTARTSKRDLASTFDLVPFYFPESGRGLKTKSVITPGTKIVSIPLCLLITPATVLRCPVGDLVNRWKVSFTPQQLLSLFLLVEKNKGTDSDWHPFINSLPSDYTLPHYFSEDELHALPLHVSLTAQRMIQRCRHAHRQVAQFCDAHFHDSKRLASWEKFRWAWCTVSSRAVFMETEKEMEQFVDLDVKDENNVALCPYLDLLNHSSDARVEAGLNAETQKYDIITEDTFAAHSEVFISYGAHDNATLSLFYGFVLPDNSQNTVSFSLDDFADLRPVFNISCWEQKQDVLRKHSLHKNLSCTMGGPSWNLMCALKILSMTWDQLQKSERAVMGQELSPAIELSARRMARHLLQQTLAKSQAQLAKLPPTEPLSPHLSMAHTLITDDINIVTVSLHALS